MKKSQQGFSLLELACLMLLMGLVGLAAVPSMHQVRKQEVDQFTRTLYLDLSRQKSEFDRGSGNEYTLKLINNPAGKAIGYEIIETIGAVSSTIATRMGNDSFEITIFNPDGSVPGVPVESLNFKDGKVKNGILEYKEIKIEVKSKSAGKEISQMALFDMETGYYSAP